MIAGLAELKTVLGSAGGEVVPALDDRLRRAMAARDRGDPVQAFEHVSGAMELLAQAAAGLDPDEAAAMRVVLEQFRKALRRLDDAGAKRLAEIMFERSGARWKKS